MVKKWPRHRWAGILVDSFGRTYDEESIVSGNGAENIDGESVVSVNEETSSLTLVAVSGIDGFGWRRFSTRFFRFLVWDL